MSDAVQSKSTELADPRRDVIELRDWQAAVLGKCKASDGWDAMEWGGDKEGWGFVHFFIGHLETRALHAESVLAEQDAMRGVAQTGRNRDPIFAPDGKTWYQTALDEAAKRGENELRIHELEAQLAALPAVNKGEGDGYRAAWLELLGFCNTLKAERFRLEQTIRDSIEALERNSTSAPVVECLKAAIDATPQPASNAGGETWTADGFWQFVGGLAGKFEADQMRDMLGQKGLQIVGIGDSAYASSDAFTQGVREAVFAKCAAIAEQYNDCGGDFIAQKIRDEAYAMPSTTSGGAAK